jgi:cytidine deaminase
MPRAPTEDERALWEQAQAATERAYAPYSGFRVGAALRTPQGDVVTGGNVENASFGVTICAEQAAVVRAVAEGRREFDAIAVAASSDAETVSPCGACRQVLAEFAPGLTVVYRRGGEVVAESLAELLPATFALRSQA